MVAERNESLKKPGRRREESESFQTGAGLDMRNLCHNLAHLMMLIHHLKLLPEHFNGQVFALDLPAHVKRFEDPPEQDQEAKDTRA